MGTLVSVCRCFLDVGPRLRGASSVRPVVRCKSRGLANAGLSPSVHVASSSSARCVGLLTNVDTCASRPVGGKMEQGYFCRHQSLAVGLSLRHAGKEKGRETGQFAGETQHNATRGSTPFPELLCARNPFPRRPRHGAREFVAGSTSPRRGLSLFSKLETARWRRRISHWPWTGDWWL